MWRSRASATFFHALHRTGLTSFLGAGFVLFALVMIEIIVVPIQSLVQDIASNFLEPQIGKYLTYIGTSSIGAIILSGTIYLVHRCAKDTLTPRIEERECLQPKALIIYLSGPCPDCRDDDERTKKKIEEIREKFSRGDAPQASLQKEKSPWRMPLTAIDRHRRSLRRVVVIPSHQTARWLGAFSHLVREMIRRSDERDVTVQAPLRTDGTGVRLETVAYDSFDPSDRFAEFAVDFENLEELQETVHRVFLALEREGVAAKKILLDVTSGTGLCNVAGAAATLPLEERTIEWVYAPPGSEPRFYIFSVTLRPDEIPPAS